MVDRRKRMSSFFETQFNNQKGIKTFFLKQLQEMKEVKERLNHDKKTASDLTH
jgi:hypothetical protein